MSDHHIAIIKATITVVSIFDHSFIWLLILRYDSKYVFCFLEHLFQTYLCFVLLVVFWDFYCNFWMIVIYKCNHCRKLKIWVFWNLTLCCHFCIFQRTAVPLSSGWSVCRLLFLSKASPLCLNVLLIKLIKNKSVHSCIINLSSVTCFAFVSWIHNCGVNSEHCNM